MVEREKNNLLEEVSSAQKLGEEWRVGTYFTCPVTSNIFAVPIIEVL